MEVNVSLVSDLVKISAQFESPILLSMQQVFLKEVKCTRRECSISPLLTSLCLIHIILKSFALQ